jgi:hypothetical protein
MLMLQIEDGFLPMTLLNIHTGHELKRLKVSQVKGDVEFLEQFNNKVFIKIKNRPLKILDLLT